jgi:hypothetical protein
MKRRLILVVSVLMIVLVALVAWITTRSVPEQSQQLADGSWLKLEGATYGKSQSFVHGNVWQKLLLGAIPKRFLMKQGPSERFTHYSLQKVGGRLISFAPENDSLVLWTVHRRVKQGWYQDNFIRAVVLDESGNECDTAKLHHVDSGKGYGVAAWELEAFPRRGKRVGLRIYHQDDGQWLRVAEFYADNPVKGPHPTWQPEALPATRSDGDLVVTLSDLSVGHLRPVWDSMLGFSQTRIAMGVSRSGQGSADWEPVSFLIEDATGNRRDDWSFVMFDDRDGDIGRIMPGMFNPYETWKLRIGVARKERAEFLPEELWMVRGVPFSESSLEKFAVSTNLQGAVLRLVSTNSSFATGSDHPMLEVSFTPPREDVKVSFVSAVNEEGHTLTNMLGTAYNRKEGKYYFFETGAQKTNPRRLDLTMAVHRLRYFSFITKPSLVTTNQPSEQK